MWTENAPLMQQNIAIVFPGQDGSCCSQDGWVDEWRAAHCSSHRTLPVLWDDYGGTDRSVLWCTAGKLRLLPLWHLSEACFTPIIMPWNTLSANIFWSLFCTNSVLICRKLFENKTLTSNASTKSFRFYHLMQMSKNSYLLEHNL